MMNNELKDRLIQISEAGGRHDGTFIYRPAPTLRHASGYLAGFPYLWTSFAEQAFIFRDRQQAEALLAEFPEVLKGCEVRAFNPEAAIAKAEGKG